jgi:hypothetical protein
MNNVPMLSNMVEDMLAILLARAKEVVKHGSHPSSS